MACTVAQHGTRAIRAWTSHNTPTANGTAGCENVAQGVRTGSKDWTIQEQVPVLALPVRKTTVAKNAGSPSETVWKASGEEAAAPGMLHKDTLNVIGRCVSS